MGKTTINLDVTNMPFAKFEKWFNRWVKDEKTAEEWYVELGGVLPKKNTEKKADK